MYETDCFKKTSCDWFLSFVFYASRIFSGICAKFTDRRSGDGLFHRRGVDRGLGSGKEYNERNHYRY